SDGSYSVVIYDIRQDIKVGITVSTDDLSGIGTLNEVILSSRVWSSGKSLHIAASNAGQVQIYALTGVLVKTLSIPAGESIAITTLPAGIYIVRLEGKSYKIRL
ncbi:MAG: T9SS type A sorting domain-containing protein, partial [Tannerella sp.]|nr:T9SS type A sorting domain-containing protein [Tannerella sp.]